MPKLGCLCGNVINLSPIPCPNEFALISGADMEAVFSALEDSPLTAENLLETVATSVIVCDVCGRYYISKGKDSSDYFILALEEET